MLKLYPGWEFEASPIQEDAEMNKRARDNALDAGSQFSFKGATPFDCVVAALDAYEATLKEQGEEVKDFFSKAPSVKMTKEEAAKYFPDRDEVKDEAKQAFDEMVKEFDDLFQTLAKLTRQESMSPEKRAEAEAFAIQTLLRSVLPNCVKVNYHRR